MKRRDILLGAGAAVLAAPFARVSRAARSTEPVGRWPGFTWCALCTSMVPPNEIRVLPIVSRGGRSYYQAQVAHPCGSEYLGSIPVEGYNPRRVFPLKFGRARSSIWCAKCDFWVDLEKKHPLTDWSVLSTVSCHGEWAYCRMTFAEHLGFLPYAAFDDRKYAGFTKINPRIVSYPDELFARIDVAAAP